MSQNQFKILTIGLIALLLILHFVELEQRIAQTTSSRRLKRIKADPVRVEKWLDNLRHQVETDVEVAKSHISEIIGELIATPVSHEGRTGLSLTGKPKIVGVLGVIAADSNLSNSGGPLFAKLEQILPTLSWFTKAA